MVLGALLCGVLGALFDQLTVTLSPEYFTFGKGVSDASLRLSAAGVGFRGGLPLGALYAGVLASRHSRGGPVGARRLLVWAVCAMAIAAAVCTMGLLVLDPFQVRVEASGLLTPGAANRYLACWGIHMGAYLGPLAALGLTAVSVDLER